MSKLLDTVVAKADLTDDLQHEMLGFTDPRTRKKVPGDYDKMLDDIAMRAFLQDPVAVLGDTADEFEAMMYRHLYQIMIVGRESGKLMTAGR